MRPIRSDEVWPSTATRALWQRLRIQNPRPHRIVDVVIDVGDDVGDAGDLPLDGARAMLGVRAHRHAALALGVARDAVAHLPRQVESLPLVLEDVNYSEALLVVVETARDEIVQHAFAGVPEWRVPQIVAERDRLGELLVEPEHLGDAAGDLRHLERVRQARPIVIAGRREEDLRLVLQAPERLAVDDPVAVALEGRPDRILRLGPHAPAAVGALGRLRRKDLAFALLELLAKAHGMVPLQLVSVSTIEPLQHGQYGVDRCKVCSRFAARGPGTRRRGEPSK